MLLYIVYSFSIRHHQSEWDAIVDGIDKVLLSQTFQLSVKWKMEIQSDNLCQLPPLALCDLFVSIVVKQKARAHTRRHRPRHI